MQSHNNQTFLFFFFFFCEIIKQQHTFEIYTIIDNRIAYYIRKAQISGKIWQMLGWPSFIDSLPNFSFWFSSYGSTSTLFLPVQVATRLTSLWSNRSNGSSSTVTASAKVVAVRGCFCTHRFTLYLSFSLFDGLQMVGGQGLGSSIFTWWSG